MYALKFKHQLLSDCFFLAITLKNLLMKSILPYFVSLHRYHLHDLFIAFSKTFFPISSADLIFKPAFA